MSSVEVFVVLGSSGEYSERTEWVVGVALHEVSARERVEACTRAANELIAAGWIGIEPGFCVGDGVDDDVYDSADPRFPRSKEDPGMILRHGEIRYRYEKTGVVDYYRDGWGGEEG